MLTVPWPVSPDDDVVEVTLTGDPSTAADSEALVSSSPETSTVNPVFPDSGCDSPETVMTGTGGLTFPTFVPCPTVKLELETLTVPTWESSRVTFELTRVRFPMDTPLRVMLSPLISRLDAPMLDRE